jgi:CheY-like chemotaxis protein
VKLQPILVASGDPVVLAELKMGLMRDFDVNIAASDALAVASLRTQPASAVVLHINGGEYAGAYKYALAAAKETATPVIFLAEKDNEEDEAAAFTAGAADYAVRRRGSVFPLAGRIHWLTRANKPDEPLVKMDSAHSLAHKTFLVADDIELNREILTAMLSDIEGTHIVPVTNGAEAVEAFKENPALYAVIIMDVQMPVMDGLEATRKIRGLDTPHARKVPIVALTAGTGERDIALCMEAGMNAFVEKPMAYDRLMNVLAEL